MGELPRPRPVLDEEGGKNESEVLALDSKEKINAFWEVKYGEDPASFFNEKNYNLLASVDAKIRLDLLAKASFYLSITPEMASGYFDYYPSDLDYIVTTFQTRHGFPRTNNEFNLFVISAKKIAEKMPDLGGRGSQLEKYEEIADRKNRAPSLLLKDFKITFGGKFEKFGKGAENFLKLLDEASQLSVRGTHMINAEQIFSREYQALDTEQKAEFLRLAVAELHYLLLWEEVNNSFFTQEMVDEDRRSAVEIKKRSAMFGGRQTYNRAHSMIYRTYQPVSITQLPQEFFDRDMKSTALRGGAIEEYPYHKLLLAVINELKNISAQTEENVDTLVDFWHKNRNPIFGGSVSDTLSAQNPNLAASKLLALLKKEKGDKNHLAAILYRLEFGKLGISDQGVRYLEKVYDLKEYNNPNYFAHRITADGKIGIFDEQQKAVGFFQINGLDSPEEVVEGEVLQFTYESLFKSKPNETDEERAQRQKILEEFKSNYFQTYLTDFTEETGVAFNNLSLQEQVWFLWFIKKADIKEKQQAMDFITQYGEAGLKTFLSLEHDEGAGKKIVALGEALPYADAEKVFFDHAQVMEFADAFASAVIPQIKQLVPEFSDDSFLYKLRARATEFLQVAHELVKDQAVRDYVEISAFIKSHRPALELKNCYEAVVSTAVIEIANLAGDVAIREILDQAYTRCDEENIKESLELAYGLITPQIKDAKAIRDLKDFYNKEIQFETYGINADMNAVDVEVVASVIDNNSKKRVLDLGCGTGRILTSLRQQGAAVDGLDNTSRHVELTKKQNPDAHIFEGDWKDTGLPAGSYGVIYSLGRNILHEFQLPSQNKMFAEANRLLAPGGIFIVDIPDITVEDSGYKKLADKYAQTMQARGVEHFRYGTIYDSPDGKHFATRYAYSRDDIAQLAEDNGFVIKEVKEKDLATGKGDKNIYFILKKVTDVKMRATPVITKV